MEVSYELLWKICSGFLLSFLVSGLVSLILYCSNSTLDDEKMVKSSISGGKKKKKRVKFVDQVDVIRRVDDGFVKDIEVDEVNSLVGVEKDEILMGESDDGCVGLVDLSEKDEILVGFDGGVVKGCVDVGVCLGSDVVDDQREENSTNSSMELGSGENEVDKIVGCGVHVSLGSDELVDDHRERNSMNSSNVYEGEVHDVDRVDKIVGCDVDVSLGNAALVDDHREGNLANSSNVYEEEVHEGDQVDKVVDDHGIDMIHGKEEVVDDQRGEEAKVHNNVDGEGMLNDEEEWEGIERSDLAQEFGRAKCFVENDDKERWLAMVGGNDLMMQLYGLEKVAIEGPCHEPQPMALKFVARAKWNAWQKLGNMSPEEAMEQYISVLSQNVPKWMDSSEESKSHLVGEKICSSEDAHISTSLDQQSGSANPRTSKVSDLADVSTAVDQGKE